MKTRINNEESELGITHSFLAITNGCTERSFTTEELDIYRFMIGGIIGK